jgi:hypothetical protein
MFKNMSIKEEIKNKEELKTEQRRDHRLKQCMLNVDKRWSGYMRRGNMDNLYD